jgi:hypothetical protein
MIDISKMKWPQKSIEKATMHGPSFLQGVLL